MSHEGESFYNPKNELLRKSSYIRALLDRSLPTPDRWQKIGEEGGHVRFKIDQQHGKNWDYVGLRPLVQLPERLGLLNPDLGPQLNRDITIGLVYAGYEAEHVDRLAPIADDIFDTLEYDKFIWQPRVVVEDGKIHPGPMDAFVRQALEHGMFLKSGPRFDKPHATLPTTATTPWSGDIGSFIEGLDMKGI